MLTVYGIHSFLQYVFLFEISSFLAHSSGLCYNTGNRPSCILGGGKRRQSANNRTHATDLGKEPCRAPCGRCAWLCINRTWKKRSGRDECGIFFDHSLVGWAVPSPVALKARHWG
jgi:hypothetical protein